MDEKLPWLLTYILFGSNSREITEKYKTTKRAQNITKIAGGRTEKLFLIFIRPYLQDLEFSSTHHASERNIWTSSGSIFHALSLFIVSPTRPCSTAVQKFIEVFNRQKLLLQHFQPLIKLCKMSERFACCILILVKKMEKKIAVVKAPYFSIDKWCRWPERGTEMRCNLLVLL